MTDDRCCHVLEPSRSVDPEPAVLCENEAIPEFAFCEEHLEDELEIQDPWADVDPWAEG